MVHESDVAKHTPAITTVNSGEGECCSFSLRPGTPTDQITERIQAYTAMAAELRDALEVCFGTFAGFYVVDYQSHVAVKSLLDGVQHREVVGFATGWLVGKGYKPTADTPY